MSKRFCGCCEVQVGCIIVAVCRIILTVAVSVAVFVIYFNNEVKQKLIRREIVSESGLIFCMIMSIPICIVTIKCSYWFIRGACSTNKDEIRQMYHYILIHLATFLMLFVSFNLICFLLSMIEFYFMCCSGFLIRERKGLLGEEDCLNDAETPPPQYDSCGKDSPTQTSTVVYPDEYESYTNNGMEPDANVVVETEENPFLKTGMNQRVNPFKTVRMESEENTLPESYENSIRKRNSFVNASRTENFTVHTDEGESSQNAETSANAVVETEENSAVNTVTNERVDPFKMAGRESEKNAAKESDEDPNRTVAIASEGNSFTNTGFESQENSVENCDKS